MNEAHLHLLVNHVPVIGALVSLFALAVALFWKSADFQKSALIMALIFGLTAIPAYFLTMKRSIQYVIEGIRINNHTPTIVLPGHLRSLYNNWQDILLCTLLNPL